MDFSCVKNIIFDLDGTLIDSSEGVIEATNYALTKLGRPPRRPDEIKRFIGHPLEDMFTSFTDAPLDGLKRAFQEKARHSVVASAQPLPGVEAVLVLLWKAGYRLAIATTKFAVHTEAILLKLGWVDYFAATASGDEVARVKPAPDLLLLALQRLDADPRDTVMVGDTVNDVLAARTVGMPVIAVKSPFGDVDLAGHNPDMVVAAMAGLKHIFKV